LDESRARVVQADAHAKFAEHQSKMFTALRSRHAISALEVGQANAEAKASQAAVRSLTLATARLEQDRVAPTSLGQAPRRSGAVWSSRTGFSPTPPGP
jgi:hypothetical protein